MIAVMVLSNVLFPPAPAPLAGPGDSTTVVTDRTRGVSRPGDAAGLPAGESAEVTPPPQATPAPEGAGAIGAGGLAAAGAPATAAGDTVVVRSDLYEYRFNTVGAGMVSATLYRYPDFAPNGDGEHPAQLIRPADEWFTYRIAVRGDTLSLAGRTFDASAREVRVGPEGAELRFTTAIEGSPLRFVVTYRFVPDDYRVEIRGGLEGLGDRGHTLLIGLGRGIRSNEANPREDVGQMAVVVRDRDGSIRAERLSSVDPGEVRVVEGGPFSWVASKSKYFLAAVVSNEDGTGFGGAILRGIDEPNAVRTEVALPVPAGSGGFEFLSYVGPQEFDRLQAIGQHLQNVNPFGWKILQWFIRPFGGLVIAVLVWLHQTLSLAYGWVLILFGVLSRVVLFPLYQKSMRQQMKQMAIQPEIKRIQEKYKDNPQKLQQEMMRVYKENHINPLGGCLPMLVPFPILITLFFVFQNTIEFRGVPFLWLPDLSLKDPYYIVPVLMGASMLLLNWIGQRGMETNQQMKMFTYVLPVVFTFMFAQFAAGLNLYYAASNIASLPQQMYLAKERRLARAAGGAVAPPPKPAGARPAKGGGGRRDRGGGRRSGR